MRRTNTAVVADHDAHNIRPYKGTWSLMQSPHAGMYNDYSTAVYAEALNTISINTAPRWLN